MDFKSILFVHCLEQDAGRISDREPAVVNGIATVVIENAEDLMDLPTDMPYFGQLMNCEMYSFACDGYVRCTITNDKGGARALIDGHDKKLAQTVRTYFECLERVYDAFEAGRLRKPAKVEEVDPMDFKEIAAKGETITPPTPPAPPPADIPAPTGTVEAVKTMTEQPKKKDKQK